MDLHKTAESAAMGADVQDWLDHIAWTDAIEPRLLATREALTRELVQATLNPGPKSSAAEVAGKIAGIDFVRAEISRLVREGRDAQKTLARLNVSLA